jgi:hypothetical protein
VIADIPASEKPTPRIPSSPALSYVSESFGSTPARPGTVMRGMVYVASPLLVTEKLPGIVPAGTVVGPVLPVLVANVRT